MADEDDKKVHLSDTGKSAAVQAGTSDREVAEALTGADQLPEMGKELGRPPGKPPFDPHAEAQRSVAHGTMMTFVGYGDDFEDRVRKVVSYAEDLGLFYMLATMADMDEAVVDSIVANG